MWVNFEGRKEESGELGMGKGERQGRKGTKKEGGTFSIFALPPFLSTTWMRRRRLSSPLLPFLPHNLEKEEGILSFSFYLSTFRLSSLSFPLPLPRSLRTREEDCQEGSVLFVHSPPLFFALLFLALPPLFPFSWELRPKEEEGERIGKREKEIFAKTIG